MELIGLPQKSHVVILDSPGYIEDILAGLLINVLLCVLDIIGISHFLRRYRARDMFLNGNCSFEWELFKWKYKNVEK